MNTAIPAVRLGDAEVAQIILGQSPPSSAYNMAGVGPPFFQGKADFGLLHPIPRVWCDAAQRFAEAGDVLMSVRAPVGDVNIATAVCGIGRGVAAIRAGSRTDPWFLYFALRHSKSTLEGRATGSTFESVNKAALVELEIPFPSRVEQSAIGSVLHRFTESIEREDTILSTAQDLKRAAMRTLFTHGLRGEAQKETEFGPVPAGWNVTSLAHCATVQTGVAKGRRFADAEMVEVPYLRVANVQDGHLDLTEMKDIRIRGSEIERYRLHAGDVVLTEGGDFDKLGRGFIWRGELDLCVHQNHVFAVRPHRERLLPEFFAYLAQSAYGKAYFLKVAHKTTNLACINSAKLKAFPVLVPPTLDEQREIAAILDAIDRKIDLHRRKRAVLDDLFKALLHKLMTGEIRVADLDLSALASPPTSVAAA